MTSRVVSVLCAALMLGSASRAQHVYTQLREFGFAEQAAFQPLNGLARGAGGWLYGTSRGGKGGALIYRVKDDGTGFSILRDFGGTNFPSRGSLVAGSDGALYGTLTLANGDAGVYRIQPDGSGFEVYTLPIFIPQIVSGLIEASDGRLYGTTLSGGVNESGTVFGINKDGSGFAVLHDFMAFSLADGYEPAAEPIEGPDGGLYVATRFGGNGNGGVVCRMNKNGSGFAILHHFPATGTNDGRIPNGRLAVAPGGFLYGTTEAGGILGEDELLAGAGVVYRVTIDGELYSVVRHFEAGINDGIKPKDIFLGSDGDLYGTSQNAGYAANVDGIFRMTTTGTGFGFIYTWVSADNQSVQLNPIFQSPEGVLYGTVTAGGASGVGQAFKVLANGTQYQGLHDFSSTGADGSAPATLVRDADGTLYGATLAGGANGSGTIYKLETNGAYSILHEFPPGAGFPQGLLLASDGFLYGSSYFGEKIFRLSKDGMEHVTVANLSAAPVGSLIEGSDFLLYGVSDPGDAGQGSVYRLAADGTALQIIHTFTNATSNPVMPSGIIEASDGRLYGAAARGGGNDQGMVFKLNRDGTQYQVLHSFVAPLGAVVSPQPLREAADGHLYGTTRLGGTNGQGSIYRISTTGGYEPLYSFAADRGRPIGKLAAGADGWLYGVTEDSGDFEGGVLFRFNILAAPTVYFLHHFGAGTLGRNPVAGVVVGPKEEILGTTRFGGFGAGFGTIFRVDLRPVLTARRAGSNLELSWPWNGDYYNLMTSSSLTASFAPLNVPRTNMAERVIATVPFETGNRFYLLQKPPPPP